MSHNKVEMQTRLQGTIKEIEAEVMPKLVVLGTEFSVVRVFESDTLIPYS